MTISRPMPATLGFYMEHDPIGLIGKVYQIREYVHTIKNIWYDIKTRDLILDTTECDLGEYGHMGSEKINLTLSTDLHDLPELIEGVNANRIHPTESIYCQTAI